MIYIILVIFITFVISYKLYKTPGLEYDDGE